MNSIFINGIGLFCSRFANWQQCIEHWHNKNTSPVKVTPAHSPLLSPREQRRCGEIIHITLSAAQQAIDMANIDKQQLASVFSTSNGDLALFDYLCQALTDEKKIVSPTNFIIHS
ncbi:MAG: hypothetical protein JKY13_03560 [Gammaproteobacteria bacterium]|nr:hypothetical protein [Gammaproteobacteria bacterium]